MHDAYGVESAKHLLITCSSDGQLGRTFRHPSPNALACDSDNCCHGITMSWYGMLAVLGVLTPEGAISMSLLYLHPQRDALVVQPGVVLSSTAVIPCVGGDPTATYGTGHSAEI